MPGYRINVRNCKRAAVLANNRTTYTIDTPVAMPTLRSVDVTLKSSTGELYGDGELVSQIAKLTGATIQFGIDKVTLADRVALTGATKTAKGVLQVKTTDTPPAVALYFEMQHDDGGYEAVWLLVGKCQPMSISAQQQESNITYSTETITIDFVRREKDKIVLMHADTDDSSFDTAAQTAFAAAPDI